MTGRFTFPEPSDGAGIMRRVDELTITLSKAEMGDGEPDIIFGSFKLSGSVGTMDEGTDEEDMAFLHRLMARFQTVER